jgi:hypothetical protein
MVTSITLDNFPRHATRVEDVNPAQILLLSGMAAAVVGALMTGQTVSIRISGFADRDPQGRDFENAVSVDRAKNAQSFLWTEIEQKSAAAMMNTLLLRHVSFAVQGFGSNARVFVSPNSEEERQANRRVIISADVAPLPPVPLDQVIEESDAALSQIQTPGPLRRLRCLLDKVRNPNVIDGFFDFRALMSIPGSAGWPRELTEEQLQIAARATTVHAVAQLRIIQSSNAGNAAGLAAGLGHLDDNIGRNINDFETQLVGDSASGILHRTYLASIGSLQQNPRAIYSCYAGYARIRHDQ